MADVQVLNVRQIVVALEQHGADMERAVQSELDVIAGIAAARMKMRAPKFQSTLTDAVTVQKVDEMTREVISGVGYTQAVEYGVKPGGKGLPKWEKRPLDMVRWLEGHAPTGAPRRRSRVMDAATATLRDRYMGMAAHIRKFGTKAQPFVQPTYEDMKPIALARMDAAVRRVLAARPDAGGAVA